ncbi:MAG TPA: hypothetical protein VGD30_04010, partial [Telluria sp.]
MTTRRFVYRTLPQELRDTRLWRRVDIEALPLEDRERFTRMARAVESYIALGRITTISKEFGFTPEMILRSLNRCLAFAADGKIMGWAGLLKGTRLKEYRRETELPKGRPGQARGFAGSFSAFLAEYPVIKEKLDSLILKRTKRGVVHEAKIAAKNVHKTFVRLAEEAGLTREDYPLNSKSCGRRSVERYMQQLTESELGAGTGARYGADASARLRVGTGHPRRVQAIAPFDLVGLDAHEMHCIGAVRVNGPAGPQWVPIERLWIVPVVEQECKVILGYSVGIRTECSAS